MEVISNSIQWIIAASALLAGSGIYAAFRRAIKEIREAYKEGEIIYKKIQDYKVDGFNNQEMRDLMKEFEVFYKEGKEALEASKSVWLIVLRLWSSKKKK